MTLEEAAQKLSQALNRALSADPHLCAAAREVAAHGIEVELHFEIALERSTPASNHSDEQFLRHLRIHPDLEVRE